MREHFTIHQYSLLDEFRRYSRFELKPGSLYRVDYKRMRPVINRIGRFKICLQNGYFLTPEEGEFVMCVSKPEKVAMHAINEDFIGQYWTTEFLYNERVGTYTILNTPMDLKEYEFNVNLRLLQEFIYT